MTGDSTPASTDFLSTLPPTRSQRRLALGVVLVSVACFLVIVPFSKMPLAPLWAFIPTWSATIILAGRRQLSWPVI